jgi:thiamine biosynthesis lipoprotein
MPVRYWQSVSVVSPLCVVAGSCATIAMLLEADAPAFLESQGVQWLGIEADGSLRRP